MQFVSSNGYRLLFKRAASCIKFVESGFMTNVIDVGDKRVPRLHQSDLVSLSVAVVPSMSGKNIDVKLMLSAIISRTGVKPMDP